MTTIYGIKNCDSMKKAFAWLDEQGIAYTFHDYKKLGIDSGKLHEWSKVVGWKALLNARGTTLLLVGSLGAQQPAARRGWFMLAVVSQRTNLAARARFDGQVG